MHRIKHRSSYPIGPLILSFLIICIIANILFSGLRSLQEYKKSADPSVAFSLENVHFFTREYLYQQYLKLTTPSIQEHDLPQFHIFSDESSITKLNENLPMSGKKQFVSGHILINNSGTNTDNNYSGSMDFRYRGGLPLHWLYEKKSYRIKLPDYSTLNGEQSFNLVVPSTMQTITDWLSYDMSRSLGILTPDYYPIEVLINNKSNGLHYYLSSIDESFLRKNNRMPGSIYSGDTLNLSDPLNTGIATNEDTFVGNDGVSILWNDARMWAKDSSRNSESQNDRTDINQFINAVNNKDPIEFMNQFDTYFDTTKFYRYLALDTLLGNFHHDFYHNHKIYFDPYRGKYEPIEWDLRIWSNLPVKDIVEYPLLKQIIRNPLLEFERDKIVYELLSTFSSEIIQSKIEQATSSISPLLIHDPLRSAPAPFHSTTRRQKNVPFSIKEFSMAINELIAINKFRNQVLSNILDYSEVSFELQNIAFNQVKLTITIDGNSPFTFNPYSLLTSTSINNVNIFRVHKDKLYQLEQNTPETIYPGRKTVSGNTIGKTDALSLKTFGNSQSVFSPLRYEYIYKGADIVSLLKIIELHGNNAITGSPLTASINNTIVSIEDTESIHPWDLIDHNETSENNIHLSGSISLDKDLIFTNKQKVTIAANTIISLCKGCSIFFYGGVIAEGSKEQPIIFNRLQEDQAWGSIVIQGQQSKNSKLNYIIIEGGSITSRNMINYPGQLNIHDSNNFQLTNCVVNNNILGDDSVHIAYSTGVVSGCSFNNSAFDALDIDISKVEVSHVNFSNSGNDAIDLMSSEVNVSDSSFLKAGDKCISVGEKSNLLLQNSSLSSCNIGIAVKDGSTSILENITFKDFSKEAISLYQKNTRFSQGGSIKGDKISGISLTDISITGKSENFITKKNIIVE